MRISRISNFFLVGLTLFLSLISNEMMYAQTRIEVITRTISLNEAVQLAMLNSLELSMVRKDSAEAEQNILNAKMARAPSLGAGMNYNYIGNPVIYRDFYSNDTNISYYNHQGGWNISAGFPIYMGDPYKPGLNRKNTKPNPERNS